AIVNYLAQMSWTPPESWNPADGREVFSLDEAGDMFDLKKLSTSPAVCDNQKLNWFNGIYIRKMPLPVVTERARAFLQDSHLKSYNDAEL
ncbi:hypothetical protein ABTE37_19645, partial [Acinetobacter baumannii]